VTHNNQLFQIYGLGYPVVLIPGFASKADSWGLQYRWLKKYFQVIVFENKSIACTQSKSEDYIDIAVSDINDALRTCSIKKVSLLGASMGAMIALEFAQRFPEKVSSLIFASLPIDDNLSFKNLTEDLNLSIQNNSDRDFFLRKLSTVFFSPDFVKQETFNILSDFFMQNGKSFSNDALCAQLCAVNNWLESKKWIDGCQCPCLFIYGSEDQLVSVKNTINQLTNVFKKSEVKIINGAGHAVHIEQYQEFNDIVYDFLQKFLGSNLDGLLPKVLFS